ncbi:MAG: hypothetical protein ACRCUM_02710 [Mycoplasmoidaceae bacterium]
MINLKEINLTPKEEKKYVSFEIPLENILIETKDKLFIAIEKGKKPAFWIDKRQAKIFNEFKLSFIASFSLDLYKGKEPELNIFQDKDLVGSIHPQKLEECFRKIEGK